LKIDNVTISCLSFVLLESRWRWEKIEIVHTANGKFFLRFKNWNEWVSESDCCLMPKWAIFQLYHDDNKLHLMKWWWCPLCNWIDTNSDSSLNQQSSVRHVAPLKHTILIPSSLNQQSSVRHVAPLKHTILIPSQPVSYSWMYVLSEKAANTNFIVFGLILPGLEPMIYHARVTHSNHYTIDVV
jgi:hypothetical protein